VRKAVSEKLAGYFFIGPSVLGYLAFVLGPLIAAIGLSFTHYDVLSPPRLVGFGNYARLVADPRLAIVYRNTGFFALASVSLTVSLGVLLAVAVNQRLPGPLKYALRTAYFFPVLVGMIYAAMVWKFLFNRDLGVVNYYLHFLQVPLVSDSRLCVEKCWLYDADDAGRLAKHFQRDLRGCEDRWRPAGDGILSNYDSAPNAGAPVQRHDHQHQCATRI
jgi:ABC-type sugar transport system permease subunit